MKISIFRLFLLCSLLFFVGCSGTNPILSKNLGSDKVIYDYSFKDIYGKEIFLGKFKGQVLLISNVALNCGTTLQLGDLEKLYSKNKDKGLVVLGFPSEDFSSFGSRGISEVKDVCLKEYKTTFPLAQKTSMKGKEVSELFSYLMNSGNSKTDGEINFNFEKFLISKKGKVVKRFGSFTNVLSSSFTRELEKLLKE